MSEPLIVTRHFVADASAAVHIAKGWLGRLVACALMLVATFSWAIDNPARVAGGVASFSDKQQPGSYHLMVDAAAIPLSKKLAVRLQANLESALKERGYTKQSTMLSADYAIVLRLGALADTPTIDDILDRGADPDQPLPEGVRFVRLEAYELQPYRSFVEEHGDHANVEVAFDFLAWEAVVHSYGKVTELSAVLPSLVAIAGNHIATTTEGTETFDIPL